MSRTFLAHGAIGALTFLAYLWASAPSSEATSFNPFFGPTDFYRLSSTDPGANPDTSAQFNVLEPSSNSASTFMSINFADLDSLIADSAGIPGVGAYMGRIQMLQIMGIANEGCNSAVPVSFDLVEAATDTTALSITNRGPMTLAAPIVAVDTTVIYDHRLDPMGVRPDGLPVNEIRIDSEEMLITGVNTATNTYTVVRGWNGTTPAPHIAGAEIKRVNVIYPSGPPYSLLTNFVEDDGDLDNNGVPEFASSSPTSPSPNANFITDSADALPSFVREYFDPNRDAADGGSQQARARYTGVARNAAHVLQVFQVLVLDPGALSVLPNLDWATAAWGYPVLTMYQDPLGPSSNAFGGSDLCNFNSNTILFGVPHDNACTGNPSPPGGCTALADGLTYRLAVDGGCPPASPTNPNECGLTGQPNGICSATTCPRSTNPASAQTVRFYQYAVSQRDYDGDGHENALDSCASDPNASWDPRKQNFVTGEDADGDGLPTTCDPNDGSFNDDQDGDGWVNRLDGCPTVADAAPDGGAGIIPNTFQYDQDVSAGQPVPDGGPHADDIAPSCDVAGESCAGCPLLTPTGANGHYHATAAAQTICIGTPADITPCSNSLDDDRDGVVNSSDTCISGSNAPTLFPGPSAHDFLTGGTAIGTNQISVGSTAGFVDGQPMVIGTGAQRESLRYITFIPNATTIQFGDYAGPPPLDQSLAKAHAAGETVAQVMFAQSLRDFNNDGFSDGTDITIVAGSFGKIGGDPSKPAGYQGRFDLNNDSLNDGTDITILAGGFGKRC